VTVRNSTDLLRARDLLGDAAGAFPAVEWDKAAVMEEEDSVGHISHAGQLVGGDDRGGCHQVRLSHEPWALNFAPHSRIVVDEEQTVGLRTPLVDVLGADE